jgi:hypothetical protein
MDDSSFPTLPAVVAFLSDDPLVMANYLVRYYSTDSEFENQIPSI